MMKIGKAELFLICYIPVYIIIVFLAKQLFLTIAECPGGGCDEITLVEWILFGLTIAVLSIIGIKVYLYLKK